MAKKDNISLVPQCGDMDMELLRRQMKRLEDALTEIKNEMANVATKISAPRYASCHPRANGNYGD